MLNLSGVCAGIEANKEIKTQNGTKIIHEALIVDGMQTYRVTSQKTLNFDKGEEIQIPVSVKVQNGYLKYYAE